MPAGKILCITASSIEAAALKSEKGIILSPEGNGRISLLISGVGAASTMYNLCSWLSTHEKPDLVINAGIAGSFRKELGIGSVVMPVTDCFADSGIEDRNEFYTLFEAGLSDPDEFPYKGGLLHADMPYSGKLDGIAKVNAVTTNSATGSAATRERLLKKFNPDIETLEGAAFFYICLREKIPFLCLRAISNMVEPRNRESWDIPLAVRNLSVTLADILKTF